MNKKYYCFCSVKQYSRNGDIKNYGKYLNRVYQHYSNSTIVPSESYRNVVFKSCKSSYCEELDRMISSGELRISYLKKNATVFDEIVLRVNAEYIELNGGYDFAVEFYRRSFEYIKKKMGEEYILEAIMHADQYNKYYSKKYGHPVWNYHLHTMAIPVVEKEIYYPKNCKDIELRGTYKEKIWQVSHSKKWQSQYVADCYGNIHRVPSYSIIQDEYAQFLNNQGYENIIRGKKKTSQLKKSNIDFKIEQSQKELDDITKKISITKSVAANISMLDGIGKQIETGEYILNKDEYSLLKNISMHCFKYKGMVMYDRELLRRQKEIIQSQNERISELSSNNIDSMNDDSTNNTEISNSKKGDIDLIIQSAKQRSSVLNNKNNSSVNKLL